MVVVNDPHICQGENHTPGQNWEAVGNTDMGFHLELTSNEASVLQFISYQQTSEHKQYSSVFSCSPHKCMGLTIKPAQCRELWSGARVCAQCQIKAATFTAFGICGEREGGRGITKQPGAQGNGAHGGSGNSWLLLYCWPIWWL